MSDLDYVENFPINVELRNNTGKIAGTYKYDDAGDIIVLKPKEFEPSVVKEVFLHECGHLIFNRYLTDKQRADWVEFYHKGVKLQTASKEEVAAICQDFYDNHMSVGEYYDKLGEDERAIAIFDNIIDYIIDKHHIGIKFIDLLIEAGKPLKPYFPKGKIKLTDYNVLVSEYGEKNPEELFCEAFSFYFMKYKLEQQVKDMLKSVVK